MARKALDLSGRRFGRLVAIESSYKLITINGGMVLSGEKPMNKGTVISLCDLTGIMVQPWVESGYRAVLVDPQHKEQSNQGGGRTITVHHIGCNAPPF